MAVRQAGEEVGNAGIVVDQLPGDRHRLAVLGLGLGRISPVGQQQPEAGVTVRQERPCRGGSGTQAGHPGR